jgi:predicted peroxiredoxin
MINSTGKKLEKIIFKLFDDASQGVDRYNHNGSLWAIFTNDMKWVVEYTKDQTLWYNYRFFKDEMELVSLDCVENKDLIKKWFELRFLGIPKVEDTIQNGVKHTLEDQLAGYHAVEDAIQNGVKHTTPDASTIVYAVENTVQNGAKQTELSKRDFFPKDIIQNGVKETKRPLPPRTKRVEDAIENGVKHTEDGDWLDCDERFNNIIQEGVKETHDDHSNNISRVEGIVRIGEKLN